MKFSKMLSCGIWKDKPQTDIEGLEKLEEIKRLAELQLECSGDVTYGCLDLRKA